MTHECVTHHNACDCQEAEHQFQIEKRDKEISLLRDTLKKVDAAIKSDLWKCWHGNERFDECNDLAALVDEVSNVK